MRRVLESIIFEVIARTFIRNLHRELSEYSIPDPAIARIKEAGRQIFYKSSGKQTDLQAIGILAMCSLVLAAYRELSAIESCESAQEVVDRAFSTAISSGMRLMARLAMVILRDPVKILARIPLARLGRLIYGKGMGFQQWSTSDSILASSTW